MLGLVCVAPLESRVFHPGPKTSDRFPPCWTFLTINLWEVTGQRKELCMHVYAHAPLSLAFTHAVFTSGPPDASTGSAPFEYERMWTGGGNWMQVLFFRQESNNCGFCNWVCFPFACHAAFPPHAVLTTFRPDLIRCNTCVERTCRWKRAAIQTRYSWLQ